MLLTGVEKLAIVNTKGAEKMKTLGLDIGTTTISAVVAENTQILTALTLKNGSFLASSNSWERIQDPNFIRTTALQAVETLLRQHPDTARIGLTGQMHGILYLDRTGNPVSPLYTWQDGRGDQRYDGALTYTEVLERTTGYALAAGYGMVTHFYNLKNGLVPENAVVLCTIQDYLAMVLTESSAPVTDASDGASFGMFDVEKGCFDATALEMAGINPAMLPPIAKNPHIGCYKGKIPVYAAIGDNQASFLGAVGGELQSMLVNVGTGGQFSVYTPEYMTCPGLETRPFLGGFLLVGASLCGGRAYALMERFFRDSVFAMTGECPENCYDAMDKLLRQGMPENIPELTPLFQGTRQDPTLRGSLVGLSTENFTPRHFLWAMLKGMAGELHGMYRQYLLGGGKPARLVGSGNGLRMNRHLQRCVSEAFDMTLTMSACAEEAAAGAALFAAQNM